MRCVSGNQDTDGHERYKNLPFLRLESHCLWNQFNHPDQILLT